MTEMRPAEANHPLTARRRQGVVIDVANMPTSINVNVGGDTTTLVPCAYVREYAPQVNDVVTLLENGGDFIAVGALAGLSPTGQTIQHGSFTFSFPGGSPASSVANITFATAMPGAPDLVITMKSITANTVLSASYNSITSTGFAAIARLDSGANFGPNTVEARYIAIYG